MEIMKKHCKKLMDVASKVGLIINDNKTEYTKLTRRVRMYLSMWRENRSRTYILQVPQFKYLGAFLTEEMR